MVSLQNAVLSCAIETFLVSLREGILFPFAVSAAKGFLKTFISSLSISTSTTTEPTLNLLR